MAKTDPAKLTKVSVSLPFGIGRAEWEADPTERRAAWSLYIELITRIATQSIDLDLGLIREALTSLHNLFNITREILRTAGPDVGASRESVGGIAIIVLNKGIRPFLTKWHPELQQWESTMPPGTSPKEHEKNWPKEVDCRGELENLRKNLEQYASALAEIAGVSK